MMDFIPFNTGLFGTPAPLLAALAVTGWVLHSAWALVLGAAVAWMCTGRKASARWTLAALMMLWTLLPGAVSPAYWLGLAFQSPSLASELLCFSYLVRQWRGHADCQPKSDQPVEGADDWRNAWVVSGTLAVLLGWVMLLDTLAFWPVSLYAWGFSPAALALTGALVTWLWLAWGGRPDGRQASIWMAAVLGLYAVTRWPSGNVWDAVLDPFLWLALQVMAIRHLVRQHPVICHGNQS